MPSEHAKKAAAAKKAARAKSVAAAGAAGPAAAGGDGATAAATADGAEPGVAAAAGAATAAPAAAAPDVAIVFPPTLTPRQRAALHAAAEAAGLPHLSAGEGAARHIVLGDPARASRRVDAPGGGGDGPPSDGELCDLLRLHLGLDAAPHFSDAAAPRAGGGRRPSPAAAAARAAGFGAAGRSELAKAPVSLAEFVERTARLLEMEREADIQQATEATSLCSPERAQARGRALLNLRLSDAEGGLLGRTLLTLVPNKGFGSGPPAPLPQHKLSPHDVVALRPNSQPQGAGGAPLCGGLVYRVREGAIVVAVDEVPEEGLEQPLRLEKLANEVTYKRLRSTLQLLAAPSPSADRPLPGRRLAQVAYGAAKPRFAAAPPAWTPVNGRLDESQRRAVALALAAHDVALIHGPPGTGKTTAVVEVILQEVARGSRVLAAAASNIAVDNLVERLAAAAPKMRLLRLGHPARLLPQVLDSSLEAHVLRSDNSSLAKDCRKEIKALNGQLVKLEGWKRAERRQIRFELRQLYKEERTRQEKAVKEVINGAAVICCTLSGALHPQLQGQSFDVAVVDEAAQALEAACWSALLRAGRAVLAGDHLQLPPTVLSDEAAKAGLGVTLFERLQHAHGAEASEMLTTQYRMNSAIMQWASDELYQGLLEAHPSVAGHTVADLQTGGSKSAGGGDKGGSKGSGKGSGRGGGKKGAAPKDGSGGGGGGGGGDAEAAGSVPVLLLLDTAGCGFEEQREQEGDSIRNEGEARAALAHVERLLAAGLAAGDIGIITPYSAQVALLKELRPERLAGSLEISTVDGFQGREKEAIVISMVRSNESNGVGFLADARRMNVAVTRARRHCAVVCDSETVGRDPFLGRLVAYFEAHGEIESAAAAAGAGAGG